MRTYEDMPWWAHNLLICGNEGEGGGDGGSGDGGAGGTSGGTSEGEGGEGGGDQGGDGGDGDGDTDDDDTDPPDLDGLKSALRKERLDRKSNAKSVRALEKQLRDAQKQLDEVADKDKTATEKATQQAQKAQEKVTKLGERLRRQAIDTAIERAARDLKFRDVTDAISLVDRAAITVEQDEDDPSEIEVDAKSVKSAVKALADKKKHLIGEEGSDEKSGGQFGGQGKSKQKVTEEELAKKYPALQH